jgi:hypothetical protein
MQRDMLRLRLKRLKGIEIKELSQKQMGTELVDYNVMVM